MYDYGSGDRMVPININKQDIQRNIKRAKSFMDSHDSDGSGQPECPGILQKEKFNHKAHFDQMSIIIFMMSLTVFMMFIAM